MSNWFEKHSNTLITVATIILAVGALVSILDQRLDAQDKFISERFDAQDRYINQRFDTVDQRFDAVDQRFDAQDRYINQRFDAQDRYINQRFEAVDQRLDAMGKRIDRLADEVAELRKLLVGINERVSRNEGRIDVILERIQAADTPSP